MMNSIGQPVTVGEFVDVVIWTDSGQNWAESNLLAMAVHDLAEDGEDVGAFERVLRAGSGDQKTNGAENEVRLGVDRLDLFFEAPDVVSSEKKRK